MDTSATDNGSGAPIPSRAEAVLRATQRIPHGHVASYKTVGRIAGCGPRYVGRVMADFGHLVPWWRVVRADGTSYVWQRARAHWDDEGISYSGNTDDAPPVTPHAGKAHLAGRGPRVDMRAHEWHPPSEKNAD